MLFGGTVLGMSAQHTCAARLFLRLANLPGGFDNSQDDVERQVRILPTVGMVSIMDEYGY